MDNNQILGQISSCIHAIEAQNSSLSPSLVSKLREVEQALRSQNNPDQGQVYGAGQPQNVGQFQAPEVQQPAPDEQQQPNQDQAGQPTDQAVPAQKTG